MACNAIAVLVLASTFLTGFDVTDHANVQTLTTNISVNLNCKIPCGLFSCTFEMCP